MRDRVEPMPVEIARCCALRTTKSLRRSSPDRGHCKRTWDPSLMREPSAAEAKCVALIVDQVAPAGQIKAGTDSPSAARFLNAASTQKKPMTVQTPIKTPIGRPANHADIYCWLKEMITEFNFGQGAPILVNDVADRL